MGKITAACFDKTGTLTAGKASVTDIVGFTRSEADGLRFAAALESGSSHPLATAILTKQLSRRFHYLQPPTQKRSAERAFEQWSREKMSSLARLEPLRKRRR